MSHMRQGLPAVVRVESLERRSLLAADAIIAPAITSRGTLVVSGTEAEDRVSITVRGNKTRVIVRDAAARVLVDQRFVTSHFKRLAVETGDGNDLVQVSPAYTRSVEVRGGAGDDVLFEGGGLALLEGGDGNDIVGRPGDDAFASPVTMMGGAGDDLLQPDLTDIVDGGIGIDSIGRDTSARGIQHNGIERSDRFLAGIDVNGILRVTGTDGPELITLNFNGAFDETLQGNRPEWVEASMYVENLPWQPAIRFDIFDFSAAVIDGIGGDDNINLSADFARPITVNGGEGNDTLKGLDDDVLLNGGGGDDFLVSNHLWGVWHQDGRAVARSTAAGRAYGSVEMLGGAGNDTLLGDANDIVDGGAGTDTGVLSYNVVLPVDETGDNPASPALREELLSQARSTQPVLAIRAAYSRSMTFFNLERVGPQYNIVNPSIYTTEAGLEPL